MITDEERREVAARLRNYANLRELFKESPICAFINALGFGGYLDWKGVCSRLADLIEPEAERTCKMVQEHDWNDEWEPYGIFCSECDEYVYGWKSDYGYQIPKYCPNCGAKVVSE